MLRSAYEAVSSVLPANELKDAAKRFLLHSDSNKNLILADNIDSPKFGSSDLLFLAQEKSSITAVRLNHEDECEEFVVSSVSYYLWLKESMKVAEIFFNAKNLEMYLFSRDFSEAACHIMDYLSQRIRIHLIRYRTLHVQGLDEPVIYFQHLTPEDSPGEKQAERNGQDEQAASMKEKRKWATLRVSAEELEEFDRLKRLYLA